MLDDTNDKLRRNVVTISAIILATAFLGLTFNPISLASALSTSPLRPWKIWTCLFSVLLYCSLRYRFDKSASEGVDSMKAEYTTMRDRFIERLLAHELKRYFLANRRPQHIARMEPGGEPLLDRDRLERIGAIKAVDAIARIAKEDRPSRWSGRISVTIYVEGENGSSSRHGGNLRDFKIAGFKKYRLQGLLVARALYSKGAIDIWTPFALAMLAAMVCAYKLIAEYRLA